MSNQQMIGLVSYPLIRAHLYISIVFVMVVVLAGLAYSLQFIDLFPFPHIEFLSPGRIRMVHTQGVAYAWMANIFFALIMYMIPKLTNRPILSDKLGWFIFYAYNFLVLATVVMILGGICSGPRVGRNSHSTRSFHFRCRRHVCAQYCGRIDMARSR